MEDPSERLAGKQSKGVAAGRDTRVAGGPADQSARPANSRERPPARSLLARPRGAAYLTVPGKGETGRNAKRAWEMTADFRFLHNSQGERERERVRATSSVRGFSSIHQTLCQPIPALLNPIPASSSQASRLQIPSLSPSRPADPPPSPRPLPPPRLRTPSRPDVCSSQTRRALPYPTLPTLCS